jgi:hypothetical protein
LRGYPLRMVEAAGLVGWATEVPSDAAIALRESDLLEHHGIVERALAAGPCLPVRLPTWLRDKVELERMSGTQVERLEAALLRVQSRVELAVTAEWTGEVPSAAAPASGGPGRRYLAQRQQTLGRQEERQVLAREIVQAIEATVGQDLVEARHTLAPSERVVLSSALLVTEAVAGPARERLERLRHARPNVRILVNGPWPPYSFTDIGEVRGT